MSTEDRHSEIGRLVSERQTSLGTKSLLEPLLSKTSLKRPFWTG
jgi:hypothetical protein